MFVLITDDDEQAKTPERVLREILRNITNRQNQCTGFDCKTFVDSSSRFCSKCGTENLNYNYIAYRLMFSDTPENRLETDCQKGHPNLKDEPVDESQPFCSHCGERLQQETQTR